MELPHLRTMLICILSFLGFLWFSKVCRIRICDKVAKPRQDIFIQKSKTDLYRDRTWTFLAKLNSAYCPVNVLTGTQRWLKLTKPATNIFSGVCKMKNGNHFSYFVQGFVQENFVRGL